MVRCRIVTADIRVRFSVITLCDGGVKDVGREVAGSGDAAWVRGVAD